MVKLAKNLLTLIGAAAIIALTVSLCSPPAQELDPGQRRDPGAALHFVPVD